MILTIISAFVLLGTLGLQANADCLLNGVYVGTGYYRGNCVTYYCNNDGILTQWKNVECPPMSCVEGVSKYEPGDSSLPFPACCPKPICREPPRADGAPQPIQPMTIRVGYDIRTAYTYNPAQTFPVPYYYPIPYNPTYNPTP